MKRCQFLLLVFSISFSCATGLVMAQDVQFKFAEFKGSKLVVHYSLNDSITGRSYTVRLYTSKDNFLNPVDKVTGNAGLEINPGPDNVITWDAYAELGGDFDGKVSLEIRARIFIPFINADGINQYKVFKRKRKYNITWTGGSPQNILNLDLFRGDEKITSFPNLANVGHYSLEFPGYIRPGKAYRFRISDSKNKEDIVYTNQFKIKRKIPLLVKAIPVGIVGSAVYLLIKSKGTTEPDVDPPPPISK